MKNRRKLMTLSAVLLAAVSTIPSTAAEEPAYNCEMLEYTIKTGKTQKRKKKSFRTGALTRCRSRIRSRSPQMSLDYRHDRDAVPSSVNGYVRFY